MIEAGSSKKNNSLPRFWTDHSGTIRFFKYLRQNEFIQDASACFMMEMGFLFQFTSQSVERKHYAYARVRKIFFDSPDCWNKITVAADKNDLFIFGREAICGQCHIYIGFFFLVPSKRFAAIFTREGFFLESAFNHINAIKFASFNKNLVAYYGVFTPFRKGCAIIEGTNVVPFSQKMVAITGVVKPAELPWKTLYGVVEIKAVNYEGCRHGFSPIKKNPDACAGGASVRWHISPTTEGMMELFLAIILWICQQYFFKGTI